MIREEILIAHYLNKLKEQSKCVDKQVACIITDKNYNIISTGINQIIECDHNCHDKINRKCFTLHAEIIAMANLRNFNGRAKYAYLNLFPCVPCQNALLGFIDEIIVFGPKHKDQVFDNIRLEPNLYEELLNNNGQAKQLSVAQGELCELVTAISDHFYRGDKGSNITHLLDEIIDAELMLDQVKLICWKKDSGTFNKLRFLRKKKYEKVLKAVIEKVYK